MALKEIGPYRAGDRPDPQVFTFKTDSGAVRNITGYTVGVIWKDILTGGATAVEDTVNVALTTDGSDGQVTWTWTDASTATPGTYEIEVWAGDGTRRYSPTNDVRYEIKARLGDVPTGV